MEHSPPAVRRAPLFFSNFSRTLQCHRGGWDNQLLGQGLTYTAEKYLTFLTPPLVCLLTVLCNSIRPMPWPSRFIRVQSQRVDFCLRYFIRLVKGSFGQYTRTPKQNHVAPGQRG